MLFKATGFAEAFTTETSGVFETTFDSFFISDFFNAGIFFTGTFSFAADFFTAVVFLQSLPLSLKFFVLALT